MAAGKTDLAAAGRPQEADARERIEAAAAELYADKGYAGTSMQTIADAAGVNKAMLYYYFESKQDLYSAIIRGGLEAMGRALDEIAAQPTSAREKVAEFAQRFYLAMSERPAVVRIIHRELLGLGERRDLSLSDHIGQQVAGLERIIREGIERGEFRSVDPGLAVRSLMGMLHVFINESAVSGQPYPADKVIGHTVELFCKGIAK